MFLRAWNVNDLSPAGPEIVHSWGAYDFYHYTREARYLWFDETDQDVIVVAGDIFVVNTAFRRVSRSPSAPCKTAATPWVSADPEDSPIAAPAGH